MRIAIIGLGHLGMVTAGCLTKGGHEVLGIDRDRAKVSAISQGRSPIDEPGLARLIRGAWLRGRIRAIDRISAGVFECDLILVCVDTPPTAKGSLSISRVLQVCERLHQADQESKATPLVVIRSTLPPGAFDSALARFSAPGGKLRLVYNPDFSREGSAVADFLNPTHIVIGARDRREARKLRLLYKSCKAPVFVTTWNNAEILKCAENAFHALKVTFANEIGSICESFGADGEAVMSLLCADTRLNISSAYLHPGLPFGGPCLDKDVNALLGCARQRDLTTPLLRAILQSNAKHFERIVQSLKSKGYSVGFLGLGHKANVRDHRGSHLLALAERLHTDGVKVNIFDPHLSKQQVSADSLPSTSLPLARSSREILRRSDIVFAPRKTRSAAH
jgi:GDP-mannose 6-dehydrogenase